MPNLLIVNQTYVNNLDGQTSYPMVFVPMWQPVSAITISEIDTQALTTTSAGGNISVLAGPIQHDIIGINQADDFELTYTYKPTWTSITVNTDDVAFGLAGNITFVNNETSNTSVFPITGGGLQLDNITSTQAVNTLNRTFTHSVPFSGRAEYYGLDPDVWYASKANVSFVGYNTATGGDFTDVSYTMKSQNRFYRT